MQQSADNCEETVEVSSDVSNDPRMEQLNVADQHNEHQIASLENVGIETDSVLKQCDDSGENIDGSDHYVESDSSSSSSRYESLDDVSVVIPLVEWIYPDGDESQGDERNPNRNRNGNRNRVRDESNPTEYVVNPNHVDVMLEVEGRVVQPRRCYMKVFGIVVCSDDYTCYVNFKVIPTIILVIVGMVLGLTLTRQNNIYTFEGGNENIAFPSVFPSTHPSFAPIDPRVANITLLLRNISGEEILMDGFPQNKALLWILYEDELKLEYNDANIVQRYVAKLLFFHLLGENWVHKKDFGTASHECNWFGIICDTISKRISILNFDNSHVTGRIPPEIAKLERLEVLGLSASGVSGTIPSEIGQLSALLVVRLDDCSLTGNIPIEIMNCRYLRLFNVNDNMLEGTIPTILGNLRSLQELKLNGNKFSGPIPTEVGNLRVLQTLFIHSNKLNGTLPTEFEQLSFLEDFRCHQNNIVGTIPSGIGKLPDVVQLIFDSNSLSGTIPSILFEIPRLRTLGCDNNLFTGNIPTFDPASLPLLNVVKLSKNLLNGTIPESFGGLPSLKSLSLHKTNLIGTMPNIVCDLGLVTLTADCDAENEEVICVCCTKCF